MFKHVHKDATDGRQDYIKPCPICGYHIQQNWRKDLRGPQHVDWFNSHAMERPVVLYCVKCHCSISGRDLKDAIARWNDRRRYDRRE